MFQSLMKATAKAVRSATLAFSLLLLLCTATLTEDSSQIQEPHQGGKGLVALRGNYSSVPPILNPESALFRGDESGLKAAGVVCTEQESILFALIL
jgi:hypothetical protein